MLKKLIFIFIIIGSGVHAQQVNSLIVSKKIVFTKDTIQIEKYSINNSNFKLIDANKQQINT